MSPRPLARSRPRRKKNQSRWMPDPLREAITLVLARIKGGVIALAALLIAFVLVTYTPYDPSLNVATAQATHNILGPWGSITADILWQYFGVAGFLFSAVLLAWAWRIGTQRELDLFWGRCLAAIVAAAAAGVSLAAFMPEATLGYSSFWGGAFGKLIAPKLAHWLPHVWGGYVVGVVMLILSLSTLYMASALTFDEWQEGRETFSQWLHEKMDALAEKVSGWWDALLLRRAEADDEEEEEDVETEEEADNEADYEEEELEEEEEEAEEEEEESDEESEEEEEKEDPGILTKKELAAKKKKPLVHRPAHTVKQARLPLRSDEPHQLPPVELLQWPDTSRKSPAELSEGALEKNAKLLESVLADFGVYGQITKVSPGPVVTLYELEPSPGTRASRVISLADDIARNMSAVSVRVAIVQGRNVIGIELPNKKREMVFLRELLSTEAFTDNKGVLPLVLGKDIAGTPIIADLVRMPHLLIAGTTGSGKSVAINTMILSLLYRFPPQKCRFIMIDPKMLELASYEGIPHLLAPVVTDPKKAIMALKWAVREMEERYRAMSKLGVRNIEGYNIRLREAAKNDEKLMRTVQTGFDRETGKPVYEEQPLDLTPLPHIVVIVDEMADLMVVAGKDIESAVQRLAQMARAAGIHLLMATQRPSVDVITGTIKANFPTRISFQVTSKIDSRTILNEQGAEQLLGQGDMLYMAGGGRIMRVHGPFVSDDEVTEVVKFLKDQGEPEYLSEVTEGDDEEGGSSGGFNLGGGDGSNDLFDKAVDIVLRERKASISFVQRQLSIGYNKAATLIERMEKEGIIGAANHVGKREILGRKPDDDR
ncbi:MAG: DNA translocase FtsK 4TM domain-containing protein [Alphaproteobacteria bacterium]|nr:DNA translocase FtsK 4TM domain-containing protein [Alphaproteobacteria bacterium]